MRTHSNYRTLPFSLLSLRPALMLLVVLLLVTWLATPVTGQTVVGTITRSGLFPTAVAVYETGDKVLIVDKTTSHLLIYDGTSLALQTELTLTGAICDSAASLQPPMAVDETQGKAYVCVKGSFVHLRRSR